MPQKPHFEGPTIEQDTHFAKMEEVDQSKYLKYVSRANKAYDHAKKNGIPKDYQEYLKTIKDDIKRANVGVDINYEEIYALDTALSYTIWDMEQFSKLNIPTTTMTNPRWQVKQYGLKDLEDPRATREFNNPRFVRLSQSDKWSDGFGIYIGLSASWQQIKESGGGLWDPIAVLNQKAGDRFGLMKSRMGFRGYDSYGLKGDDGEVPSYVSATGLLNNASVQAFTSGDLTNLDADVTGDNEVNDSIWTALGYTKKIYQPHRKILITTGGVAAETILESHRDTYAQKLDLHRIKEKYFDTGILDGWLVTDQMLNAAAQTTSTGMMAIACIGPDLMKNHVVYPTQKIPLNDKKYQGDYREVLLYGSIFQYMNVDTTNNAFPLIIDDSMTTTVIGNQIPEGWFDVNKYAARTAAAGTGIQ